MSVGETVETEPRRRPGRALRFGLIITVVLVLLFGVPWWTLVWSGNRWPTAVFIAGTAIFAVAAAFFPVLMFSGHGPHHRDGPARIADVLLGIVWVLFVWSILGNVLRAVLALAGVADPARSRAVTAMVILIAAVLLIWGYAEAMRVSRVRRIDVVIDRLGAGLDGLKVVLLTDTHYGPINRAKWSRGVTEVVNSLDPDVVAHTGDIADGEVSERREQAAPLGDVRARLARVYVTGNHEYFGEAQGWLVHMASLGWEPLHNRHVVVSRGGASLVLAGIDDATARASGLAGHGAQLEVALAGAPAGAPVLLVAHQPRQVAQAAAAGVDLQVSGHTHGGQIWPFHYLVRVDQPTVQGLTRHGPTQLYTTRGAGFWGPPLRVFAPSESTLLTLRSGVS